LLCAGLLGSAQAAPIADWEGCSAIAADAERLACYDRLAGRPPPAVELHAAPEPVAAPSAPAEPRLLSALSRHWELDDAAKRGAFLFRPHRPNYFLPLKVSNSPNNASFPAMPGQADLRPDPVETELQLSFKIKGMQGVFGHDNVDLWFGYTATSFWQAYNGSMSSPFRENNYEPEAMLVFRTDYDLAGFRWRFLSLGLVHQSTGRGAALSSTGRGAALSRSWNRV